MRTEGDVPISSVRDSATPGATIEEAPYILVQWNRRKLNPFQIREYGTSMSLRSNDRAGDHGRPTGLGDDDGDEGEVQHPRSDRLPPPAFPPGQRRAWVHRPRTREGEPQDQGGAIPDDAFFSPHDPLRRIEDLHAHGGQSAEEEAPERHLSDEEVATLLEQLAREIRNYEGGRFLWKAGVPPLEGAIRGLISGYLRLGRREGERN